MSLGNDAKVFGDSIPRRCKAVHFVDLGESFTTHIFLQNLASIQPITSPSKFGEKFNSLFTSLLNCHHAAPSRAAARRGRRPRQLRLRACAQREVAEAQRVENAREHGRQEDHRTADHAFSPTVPRLYTCLLVNSAETFV